MQQQPLVKPGDKVAPQVHELTVQCQALQQALDDKERLITQMRRKAGSYSQALRQLQERQAAQQVIRQPRLLLSAAMSAVTSYGIREMCMCLWNRSLPVLRTGSCTMRGPLSLSCKTS